jgi:hypothetical protein
MIYARHSEQRLRPEGFEGCIGRTRPRRHGVRRPSSNSAVTLQHFRDDSSAFFATAHRAVRLVRMGQATKKRTLTTTAVALGLGVLGSPAFRRRLRDRRPRRDTGGNATPGVRRRKREAVLVGPRRAALRPDPQAANGTKAAHMATKHRAIPATVRYARFDPLLLRTGWRPRT